MFEFAEPAEPELTAEATAHGSQSKQALALIHVSKKRLRRCFLRRRQSMALRPVLYRNFKREPLAIEGQSVNPCGAPHNAVVVDCFVAVRDRQTASAPCSENPPPSAE